jgi:uncharacterized membrane protein
MATQDIRRPDGFRERGDKVTRLETFVDAAFAFAVSMLVISVGSVPDSIGELKEALKNVPAFAASFALIMVFWRGHEDWSRRYGLDDSSAAFLSIVLVFLVLVFVYPLRILFGGFFAWITGGWLPSPVTIDTLDDLRWFFGSFAVAFGSMGLLMAALTWHADRRADALGLDAGERLTTRMELLRWLLVPAIAAISLALTLLLQPGVPNWLGGMPGMIYFLLNLTGPLLRAQARRLQRRDPARYGEPG